MLNWYNSFHFFIIGGILYVKYLEKNFLNDLIECKVILFGDIALLCYLNRKLYDPGAC